MSTGHPTKLAALAMTLIGCGLGNPSQVYGPDGGFRGQDLGAADVGTPDAGVDVVVDAAPRDVGGELALDVGADVIDAPAPLDLGDDLGPADVGVDAGPPDAGPSDTGPMDTGQIDAGPMDAGRPDAGPPDTGPLDIGPLDVGPPDTGPLDIGPPDTGRPDTGPLDTGVDVPVIIDVGPPDTGPTVVTSPTNRCTLTGTAAVTGFGRYVLSGNTSSGGLDHRASCNESTRDAPDVGFLVTLTAASRLTWTARPTGGASFVPVVYLTQNCTAAATDDSRFRDEVACVDNGGAPMLTRGGVLDLPAGNYYLVVDGYRSGTTTNAGTFEVALDVGAAPSPVYQVDPLTTLRCSTVPSGTTDVPDGDDQVSGIEGLGFTFNFFGRGFDRIAFYTNGFFGFIVDETAPWNSESWRNHSIVFDGRPRGVVAPFWDDLWVEASSSTSDAYFWVDGAAGSRVAHVYWRNVTFYWDRGTAVSFEARLFQGTNVIEFVYCGENRMNDRSRGGSATIGLESYDQTAGVLVGLNRAGAAAPNTGYRFTPR